MFLQAKPNPNGAFGKDIETMRELFCTIILFIDQRGEELRAKKIHKDNSTGKVTNASWFGFLLRQLWEEKKKAMRGVALVTELIFYCRFYDDAKMHCSRVRIMSMKSLRQSHEKIYS